MNIAAFIDTVDPLFYPKIPGVVWYGIVGSNTPLNTFSRRLFPSRNVISIPMFSSDGYDLSQKKILYKPEFIQKLRENHISYIFIPSGSTDILDTWAKINNIILIGTPYDKGRNLEDKVYFDTLLKKNNISSPKTVLRTYKKIPVNADQWEFPVVVQQALTNGMTGTKIISSLQQLFSETSFFPARTLVRSYIEGIPLGISIFIDKDKNYLYSALRRQCFFSTGEYPSAFAGIQWLPSDFFSNTCRRNIQAVLLQLTHMLLEQRFIGVANIDFILHNENAYIIECNPRLSAATAQVFSVSELTGITDPLSFYILTFLGKKNEHVQGNMPHASYAGSVMALEVKRGNVVEELPPIGIYELRGKTLAYIDNSMESLRTNKNRICMIHYLQRKGLYTKHADLCSIIAHRPLFTFSNGRMNAEGYAVYTYFMKRFFGDSYG